MIPESAEACAFWVRDVGSICGRVSGMHVRLAASGDFERIVALRQQLWPEMADADNRAEVAAIVAGTPRSTLPLVILVADDAGQVVGFVEVGLRSHADGCNPVRPCAFLEGWYVEAGARRRGVGGALIAAAERWAAEQGCAEMASDTWSDNAISQRAHAALGFQVVDRCVNFRKSLLPARQHSGAGAPFYGPVLARVHHEHFGMVAAAAADELLLRLAAQGLTSGTVVDLAAGSGILSRRMAEAGFRVWGVDISADMLALAEQGAPGAVFVRGSLWEAELPACVAVAAVGEAFCYATDPRAGTEALEHRLATIHRVLAPGGLLLFDVAGPGRSGPDGVRRLFRTWDRLAIGVEEREAAGELTRAIASFVPVGDLCRRIDEEHVLRLYEPARIERMLDAAGFAYERLGRYADFVFPAGWHGFLATKR